MHTAPGAERVKRRWARCDSRKANAGSRAEAQDRPGRANGRGGSAGRSHRCFPFRTKVEHRPRDRRPDFRAGSGAGHRSGTVPDSHRLRDPAASKSTPMLARGEIRRACRLRQALRSQGLWSPRLQAGQAGVATGCSAGTLTFSGRAAQTRPRPAMTKVESDAGEEAGHAQTQLQGRRGDRADAQLADQGVCRTGPRLFADCCVDRVRAVEVGPVAAVDRDLVRRAGRVDRAVGGGEVLVEDDRLRAVQRVDRRRSPSGTCTRCRC